jgi:hypothetical protein
VGLTLISNVDTDELEPWMIGAWKLLAEEVRRVRMRCTALRQTLETQE